MDLSENLVFEIVQSNEAFPVNFDDAWKWIGYSRKDNAKNAFEGAGFLEGIDFEVFLINQENPKGGRPSNKIKLTIEAFKSWAMMAGTPRGKEVRAYFLRCEAELKGRLEAEAKEEKFNTQKRLVSAMVSEDVVSRKPKFPLWFYEMLYRKRGQGWEKRDPQKFRPACVGTWTNQTVYERLLGGVEPGGVKDVLNTVNPRQLNGVRKHRHHWHLKDLGEFHLQTHLYALSALANTVPDGDWDRFMRKITQAFPNGQAIQLTLLDILEEMEEIGYPSSLPT
jgi:phage anti-repressor protein